METICMKCKFCFLGKQEKHNQLVAELALSVVMVKPVWKDPSFHQDEDCWFELSSIKLLNNSLFTKQRVGTLHGKIKGGKRWGLGLRLSYAVITKTRLFKYSENINTKKMKIFR